MVLLIRCENWYLMIVNVTATEITKGGRWARGLCLCQISHGREEGGSWAVSLYDREWCGCGDKYCSRANFCLRGDRDMKGSRLDSLNVQLSNGINHISIELLLSRFDGVFWFQGRYDRLNKAV